MKPCEYFEERIDLLLDGMLEPSEEAELRAHLEVCPACAARERELREIKQALGALDAEAPPELHARIMSAVAAAAEQKPEKPSLWKRLATRRVLSGVAACAVLALVIVAWDRGGKNAAEEADLYRSTESAPAAADCESATPEAPADGVVESAPEGMTGGAGAEQKNTLTMAPETANDAGSAYAEGVMTYAVVEAYAGDPEPLREELEGSGCVRFTEDAAFWQAVFETGSQAEQDFRTRLTALGFVSAAVPEELIREPDAASPYTLFVLVLK